MLDTILWLVISIFSLVSAGHALLSKRDPRAALIWVLLCFTLPGLGAGLYWLLGINRIRTRARDWQTRGEERPWPEPNISCWLPPVDDDPVFLYENNAALLALADAVTRRPLVSGNKVEPLFNGEEAYPAMLEAIASARHEINLATYIFGSGRTGRKFVAALEAAAERGVTVRVLIDAIGERYDFPPARRLFRSKKVRIARFLPPSLFGRGIYLNLRNHRKLLVIDNRLGFTGGMNIGDRHLASDVRNPRRTADVHFRVQGPVVGQLQEAFLEDWAFATGDRFQNPEYPPAVPDGRAFCRGISAGPNEDFDKLMWLLVGAFNSARERICIMTPYFIPDRPLLVAINSAALRGVRVEIILPQKNNLPYVGWAARAYFWELLQYGARIYYQPPPFNHSKLLLVDHHYSLVGSANLDPRSLRLNFEFNLTVFDRELNHKLRRHFDAVRDQSRPITLAEVDGRPLPVKLLDSVCKLFSPYL